MNLLETFDSLLHRWRGVFSQERTFERARRLTFGLRFLTAAQVENDIGILAQHRFQRDPRILR